MSGKSNSYLEYPNINKLIYIRNLQILGEDGHQKANEAHKRVNFDLFEKQKWCKLNN